MRQDGDLDSKETIRIIVAVIVVALGIFYGVVNELRIPEVLGVVLLCLVIVVPFLLVGRQCEAVRAKGGQCDWSKAKGGTLRYAEPQLDHGIRKPYHTGRIKEARKPPSADGT